MGDEILQRDKSVGTNSPECNRVTLMMHKGNKPFFFFFLEGEDMRQKNCGRIDQGFSRPVG